MLPAMSEWLIILFVAVLIFGPSKLPQLGRAIGEGINELKKGLGGANAPEKREDKPLLSQKQDKDN